MTRRLPSPYTAVRIGVLFQDLGVGFEWEDVLDTNVQDMYSVPN